MDREKLFDAIGTLNDDLILQAAPTEQKAEYRGRRMVIAAIAAVLVLSLTVGAAAVGAPLIRGIFEQLQLNKETQNMGKAIEHVQSEAQPLEGITGHADGENPVDITVSEAFYDGRYVYVGMVLNTPARSRDGHPYDRIYASSENDDIVINGESQNQDGLIRNDRGYAYLGVNIGGLWELAPDGSYLAQVAFRVPDHLQGEQELDISMTLSHFAGWFFSDGKNRDMEAINPNPCKLRFSVRNTRVSLRRIDGAGLEMGGVKLVEAVASETGSEYTLEYPAAYNNPATGAIYEDGTSLGPLNDTPATVTENGSRKYTRIFSGIPLNETRKVLYFVYDKNGRDEYVAVFRLDFQNGTAELATPEDVEQARDMLGGHYVASDEERAESTASHTVTLVSWKPDGAYLSIIIHTTDQEPRSLQVEVWQNGELVSTGEYDGTYGKEFFRESSAYAVQVLQVESLTRDLPLDLKVYDSDTGELLTEKSVTLTK